MTNPLRLTPIRWFLAGLAIGACFAILARGCTRPPPRDPAPGRGKLYYTSVP